MKVSVERRARNAIARLIGKFAPLHKEDPSGFQKYLSANPSAKIIFIRAHQGLGDLLLATPVFRALKAASPAIQLHFLADTYNEVAIRDNPRLDKVWIWDKKKMQNPLKLWTFIRALRAERFSIAIPLSSHVPSFTSYILARICGAEFIWGFDTEPFYDGANWSRYLAHVELENRPSTDPEWVKFMTLARPLIGPVQVDYTPEYGIKLDAEARARAAWEKLKIMPGTKKIGLFFGGNPDRPERLWPADYWGQLAMLLQKNSAVSLIAIAPPPNLLSGSKALEPGVYTQVAMRLHPGTPVFADADLSRVAAFLRSLDLFVCVDGGLFHIAVASHVRTLGLFFKTDPACWKPPVEWTEVLRPADDLPRSLSPEAVYQKICEMVLKSNVTNVR